MAAASTYNISTARLSGSASSISIATDATRTKLRNSRPTALVLAGVTATAQSPLPPARFQGVVSTRPLVPSRRLPEIVQLEAQLAQSTQLVLDAQKLIRQVVMAKLEMIHQSQAESNQETHRLIHKVDDSVGIVRQKVDAILTQNFELHEYTIPRLFVVLPVPKAGVTESSPWLDWMPQLTDKFRLYFLCECDEHSKADSGDYGEQIGNTTHLAPHVGYELTCPGDFIKQYGPYLLGMLEILKACLLATTIVAPAVGHLAPHVDEVTKTVRSIATGTIEAVKYSIRSLETMLNEDGENAKSTTSSAINSGTFKNLRALKGADLRKLDTFLKDKDKDKTLGNLYRITTKEGHVKWVCLDHYRSSYRDAVMKDFLDVAKLNKGQYHPHLRKVTIKFEEPDAASKFFAQLKGAPAVNEIDIELTWDFSPPELEEMVLAIQTSNIRYCAINLNDYRQRNYYERLFARGRYESLLWLLSTPKIQSVQLTEMFFFSERSPNFSKGIVCTMLTRFEYADAVRIQDQNLFANIIQACSRLVVLRLGHSWRTSILTSDVTEAILRLENLEVLRLYHCFAKENTAIHNFLGRFPKTRRLRELVIYAGWYNKDEIYKLVCTEPSWEQLDLSGHKLDWGHIGSYLPTGHRMDPVVQVLKIQAS